MKAKVICKETEESFRVKEALMAGLKKSGIGVDAKEADVIIVIGGDGTMLGAIKEHHDTGLPFIGINTGNLGFLMNELPEEVEMLGEKLVKQEFEVYNYPLFEAEICDLEGNCYQRHFFADLIIERAEMNLTEMELYVDQIPLNYFAGDGFVISTPIGSTAYAIWTGGSAIHHSLSCLEIVPLHPNDSARNLPLKVPLVLPAETRLLLKVKLPHMRSVRVAADGFEISFRAPVVSVEVFPSTRAVSFYKIADYDYLRRIKEKIIDKERIRKI